MISPMLCQIGDLKDLERMGFVGEEKGDTATVKYRRPPDTTEPEG